MYVKVVFTERRKFLSPNYSSEVFYTSQSISGNYVGKFCYEWRVLVAHGRVSFSRTVPSYYHTLSRTMWPTSSPFFCLPCLPAFCFPSCWQYLCSLWDGKDFFYIKVFLPIFFSLWVGISDIFLENDIIFFLLLSILFTNKIETPVPRQSHHGCLLL